MIHTAEFEEAPATILHRVTGNIGIEEVKRALHEANAPIGKVVHRYGSFNLIIDPRDHKFTDLEAHKLWKMWLESGPIKEKVRFVAVVVHESPHTRAEKELMETETFRFFFDFDEARDWLQEVGCTCAGDAVDGLV